MTEVNAGYNTQVVALFGFGDPQFSKKVDKGMTADDMADIHSYAGQHHQQLARYHAQMSKLADTKEERQAAKKEAVKHAKLFEKHQNLAKHFNSMAPENKPSIVKPTPPIKPAYNSTPSSKPFPQNAPADGPKSSNTPSSNMPSTDLSEKTPMPKAPGPSKAFKFGQKVGQVADNYNSNLVKPTKALGKGIARLWKGLSPHVRDRFVKAKPNKPISQTWMRGSPNLPLPPHTLAKMHQQQADYHAGQATQAVTPESKASHVADANHHAKIAQGWIKKAIDQNSMPASATKELPPNAVKPAAPKATPKNASSKPVPALKSAKTATAKKPTAKPPSTVKTVAKPTPAVKKPTTTVKKPVAVKKVATPKVKPIDPANV